MKEKGARMGGGGGGGGGGGRKRGRKGYEHTLRQKIQGVGIELNFLGRVPTKLKGAFYHLPL